MNETSSLLHTLGNGPDYFTETNQTEFKSIIDKEKLQRYIALAFYILYITVWMIHLIVTLKFFIKTKAIPEVGRLTKQMSILANVCSTSIIVLYILSDEIIIG